MNLLLGSAFGISLLMLIVSEIHRSGRIAYWPGRPRLKATRLQLWLLAVISTSGLTLLLRAL